MINRSFQEDRARSCQELRRICRTEAERSRQLRIDEVCTQKEGSKSTVHQLMAQIQEQQDKVNSLSDAKEFYDPETASSSGLFHVPSHTMSIPSPRGMTSRDSCLQLATRNSFGTTGHVFEDLLAPDEPSSAFFGNSNNLASASCGSSIDWQRSPTDTSTIAKREDVLGKRTQDLCNTDTSICQEVFDLEYSVSCRRNLSSKIV